MNWLNNEGFLRVVHEPTSGPIIATLTQKGIVATNANFTSLDKGKKFFDFMTSSAKDITKNVVSTLVAGLFDMVVNKPRHSWPAVTATLTSSRACATPNMGTH